MVKGLREADRTTVTEAAMQYKVSEPKVYGWRKHFVQMDPADFRRLKKLVAETALDIEVPKEINSKNW